MSKQNKSSQTCNKATRQLIFLTEAKDDDALANNFILKGANIDGIDVAPNKSGHCHRTREQIPLFAAVRNQRENTVRLLLKKRVDIHQAESASGATALFEAINVGSQTLVEMLLDAGSDVDHQNHLGLTPIHAAVTRGRNDLVRCLVLRGANINVTTKHGLTPLELAIGNYGRDISRFYNTRASSYADSLALVSMLIKGTDMADMELTKYIIGISFQAGYYEVPVMLIQHGGYVDTECLFQHLRNEFIYRNVYYSPTFFELMVNVFNRYPVTGTLRHNLEDTMMKSHLQDIESLYESLTPLPLKAACRKHIRNRFIGPCWRNIDKLPLPKQLKNYLRFKELSVITDVIHTGDQ